MIPSDAFVVLVGAVIVLLAVLAGIVAVSVYELVSRAMSALNEYQETL